MIGSNGEKRPRSDHANAVRVAKILTKELEEEYVEKPEEQTAHSENQD